MWLEITGKCQLECAHCYAESGPDGDHGTMTEQDWRDLIDQAGEMGVRTVQFIGGEPTLHPSLPGLIDHARDRDVEVALYSNLVHIKPVLWEVLSQPGVRLATSYYTSDPGEHAAITQRRTHARTKANIAEAIRRSIPVRVGVINLWDGQRSDQAVEDLRVLGVVDISVDHVRQVGRGVRDRQPGVDQLFGQCGRGVVAVSPTGEVWPCVFSRWMPVGNIRTTPLAEIVAGPAMNRMLARLPGRVPSAGKSCDPTCCPNTMCDPQCSPSCSPSCTPAGNCTPSGNCAPYY
ncbi:radical SAM protein [Saccharopolyspora sp. K220]|uniref:radical SAM protein n=1 Tax=Saccharopolyspora soli TaxID=2926618 RepID=UPI001F55BEAF|nr:radical SAM protein [Saccharopolyspora soli]MCI2424023.1 radical SAM protein [Saccharopolyspora soli]